MPADNNPKLIAAVEPLAVAESPLTQYASPAELPRSEPQRSNTSVDLAPSMTDPAAGQAFELPVVQRKEPVLQPSPMRYLVSPQLSSEETPGEIRMIKVILRSTGDKRRDVLRLRRAHGMLRSVPGRDKFALMVFEGGGRYLMEFPNETTGITSDLIRALTAMVGEGNVSVETIKVL